MSDVWRELEERLKQKALSGVDLAMKGYTSLYQPYTKWVRLEDVKEAIQQLKQNYILIERQKLEDFRCFIRRKAEECLREMETEEGIVRACLEARLGVYDEITLKLMELLKEK